MKKEKKTMTTTNMIAETLKEDINHGRLNPGDNIVEREIATQFSASHIPVREALRILEGEGYIIHRKFSGYTVRVVTPEEMVELYDIHRFLSVKLLSQAIPRYNELTYYNFKSLVNEMKGTSEIKKHISLILSFTQSAYAPAGLHYSEKLAMDIFKRNIPMVSQMLEKGPKGVFQADFHDSFIRLCQDKENSKAIDLWLEEYDKLTKELVAVMSQIRSS
jgi:DNA-binding GntR family transcriptional regulator